MEAGKKMCLCQVPVIRFVGFFPFGESVVRGFLQMEVFYLSAKPPGHKTLGDDWGNLPSLKKHRIGDLNSYQNYDRYTAVDQKGRKIDLVSGIVVDSELSA